MAEGFAAEVVDYDSSSNRNFVICLCKKEGKMLTYSIAIRTLGLSGDKFRRELESITRQTLQPERVMVYIAEGYERPEFQIGREVYMWVPKGMVRQRALQYDEITSDCILLLDDDVELAPDSAAILLQAMEECHADVVGADCFKNQELPIKSKLFAALTNWVLPHTDTEWAFKIHSHCGFSYLNVPQRKIYKSQSGCGPASLWKKDVLLSLHINDEVFLEKLGFPYGEDLLMFNKVFQNGYRLMTHYECEIKHMDGKTSSGTYHRDLQKFYVRSKGSYILWWRTCYQTRPDRLYVILAYCLKVLYLFLINCVSAVTFRNIKIPYLYVKGVVDAWKFTHSVEYKQIPLFNSYQKKVLHIK